MAKVRFKARFFVMILIIVLAVAAVLYFVLSRDQGEISSGSIRLSHTVKSAIVRDEKTIATVEGYGKVTYNVVEGAHVTAGQQIAEVFRWEYQEENMQALLNVQQEILAYQMTRLDDVIRTDLDAVNASIQAKQQQVRETAQGKGGADMLTLEFELKALLQQRMDILREIVQADETLTELYLEEQTQQDNLAVWKRTITNDAGDGVVSFYFDGYELALLAEKLDMLTSDLINSVLRDSGAIVTNAAMTDSSLYRLINNGHFYLAFLTGKNEAFRVVAGEAYTVVFAGYADTPFSATAHSSFVSGEQVVNILEFNQDMGDLIDVRVVEANILKDASGMRVPLDAIKIQDGLPGILKRTGDGSAWVQVDVLAVDAEDAIIRAADGGALNEGDRFVKP